MESNNSWDIVPFGRTFIPIYALLTIKDSTFSPIYPTLHLLHHERLGG